MSAEKARIRRNCFVRASHPPCYAAPDDLAFLFLLIFPAARGFLTALSGGNVAEWLDGAWKDILIIAAILLLAFLQWWCLRYRWESVGLSIRRGVLFRQRMFIPAAKIITMSLTRPFYLKPVGGVRLRVDTWAGAGNSTDISLILPKKAAESIFSKRENALSDLDFAPREYHPKGLYVTCLAAILSSSFAGVLFFATFISQTGSLLGQEFADRITGTFERLTRAIAWGIPPGNGGRCLSDHFRMAVFLYPQFNPA